MKGSDPYAYTILYMYIRPDYHEEGVYHVYNRGVAKLPIFLKDTDYFDFRQIMHYFLIGFPEPEEAKGSDPYGPYRSNFSQRWRMQNKPVSFAADPNGNGMFRKILEMLAYCLMPNHIHFLLRICPAIDTKGSDLGFGERSDPFDPAKSISEFMKRLGITYAMKFNCDNQRVGPIFQGRFKIKEVDSDELVPHVTRYIHINPVMAGLANKPEDWKWSDVSEYFNFQPLKPECLSKPDFVLKYFNSDPKDYREFVEGQIDDEDMLRIASSVIESEP